MRKELKNLKNIGGFVKPSPSAMPGTVRAAVTKVELNGNILNFIET